MRLLVVDDQRSARRVVSHMLKELADVEVVEARSVEDAQRIFDATPIDALLLDIRLSDNPTDRGGLELLNWVRGRGRDTPAVMITAVSEIGEIREAMRQGAQDYVLKDDLCAEMLIPIIDGLRERLALRGEVARLRQQVDSTFGLRAIVGSSAAIERVRRLVERVANADAPVLIRGETGSGKELVARAIHHTGNRSSEPFLAVNCSALPGSLIESLIFGHQRGAFTGAERRVRGQLELAGRGTILLDEIAEMPIELQAKLLRVLEERRFRPLGAEEELPFEARVLSATHVDIERRILDGAFREDLYYRLNVVTLELPSLAERDDDVVELLQSFNAALPRRLHFKEDAVEWVRRRHWSGNVRELKNAVERLSLLAEHDLIDATAMTEIIGEDSGRVMREVERMAKALLALPERVGSKLDILERAVLHHAIESCGGNKSAAARLLGVHRKSLDRRLERFASPSPPEEN